MRSRVIGHGHKTTGEHPARQAFVGFSGHLNGRSSPAAPQSDRHVPSPGKGHSSGSPSHPPNASPAAAEPWHFDDIATDFGSTYRVPQPETTSTSPKWLKRIPWAKKGCPRRPPVRQRFHGLESSCPRLHLPGRRSRVRPGGHRSGRRNWADCIARSSYGPALLPPVRRQSATRSGPSGHRAQTSRRHATRRVSRAGILSSCEIPGFRPSGILPRAG